MQSIAILIVVALLATLTLSACGTAESAAKQGAEHIKQGDEYLQVGTSYLQDGENEKAQAEFDKAQAEYDQAIAKLEQALEQNPDNVDVLADLGSAYLRSFRLDEAIEHYEKALTLAPEDAGILSNMAGAYLQKFQESGSQEDLAQALAGYEAAIRADPDLAEPHFGLGVVYVVSGDNTKAIQAFERFQELDQGQDPMASDQAEQYLRQLKGQ